MLSGSDAKPRQETKLRRPPNVHSSAQRQPKHLPVTRRESQHSCRLEILHWRCVRQCALNQYSGFLRRQGWLFDSFRMTPRRCVRQSALNQCSGFLCRQGRLFDSFRPVLSDDRRSFAEGMTRLRFALPGTSECVMLSGSDTKPCRRRIFAGYPTCARASNASRSISRCLGGGVSAHVSWRFFTDDVFAKVL